ncbi:MAG: DUF6460 domain-containing protein [Proteobacteria bacterium]|nr:DUF6460 domain-containing protein [Pseudomonadota bacterium]
MGRVASSIVKILVASLVLGLLLSLFNIRPQQLLRGLGDTALQIVKVFAELFEWALGYILLGAVVIVPVWLIVAAVRHMRGRRSRD